MGRLHHSRHTSGFECSRAGGPANHNIPPRRSPWEALYKGGFECCLALFPYAAGQPTDETHGKSHTPGASLARSVTQPSVNKQSKVTVLPPPPTNSLFQLGAQSRVHFILDVWARRQTLNPTPQAHLQTYCKLWSRWVSR